MTIHTIPGRGYDSNIFIISGSEPAIIDTGTGQYQRMVSQEIKKIINPNEITKIILTHEHFDHVGGAKTIWDLTNHQASLLCHPFAKEKVEQGESMFAQMLGAHMPKITIDKTIDQEHTLQLGDETYTVMYTPGHTPGCICLYSKTTKTLFSGDTVFSHGSFGRTDFPGGSTDQLRQSLHALTQLDVEHLYPGHESVIMGGGNKHIALSFQNISTF